MRRPEKHRAIGLIIAIAGIAAIAVALARGGMRENKSLVLAIASFILLPAIVYASNAHLSARRFRRLRDGEGLIGRWTVSGELWREFHAGLGRPVPERTDDVEVLVGEESTAIDGDFHYFPVRGNQKVIDVRFFDLAAPYLVFDVETTSRHQASVGHHCVPVGLDARDTALQIVDNYMARIDEVKRKAAG